MKKPLLPLLVWAEETYGPAKPCLNTLRRWAREAMIQPPPQRHGRAYFVDPDAKYVPARPRQVRR